MSTTKKGLELANKLGRYMGWTPGIAETCSLIARHATTYNRIQERWCNDEMSDRETARVEAQEARLEARLDSLVRDLPAATINDENFEPTVRFDGDPRGYVVTIVFGADRYEVGVG